MSNKQVKLQHVADASVLYHYTKSKGVNGILHSNCFWATKSDFLNDPKEFSYIETIIREVCCELIEEKSLCDMFLEDVLEENILCGGGRSKEYFVLSFSNCRDSITMWSEFRNETGYNIGFDSKRLIARIEENNTIEYHGLVLYEMEEQKKIVRRILNEGIPNEMQLSFSEIIEAGAKNRDCEEYKKACRKFQKITAIYAMFFKNSAFREEQEYRFIFKKKGTGLYREKDGFLIPYVQIQLTDKLLPIKEIVVAPKNHIDLAKKGMEYMIAEKGYDAQVSLSNINLRY